MKRFFDFDRKAGLDKLIAMPLGGIAGGLLGIVLVLVIMAASGGADDWFCMGTMFSLMGMFIISAPLYGMSFSHQFSLAVSMGQTRRAFVNYFVLRQLLVLMLGYGIVLLVHQGELALYSALYPGIPQEGSFAFLYQPLVALGIIGGNLLIVFFYGTFYHKYGQKFYAISYLVIMGAVLLISTISKMPLFQKIMEETPKAVLVGVLIAAVVAILWSAIRMIRTMAVK